jgi:hypothetical protein
MRKGGCSNSGSDQLHNINGLESIISVTHSLTPWPESVSELYRPSDRRMSAKLVPTFADRGHYRSQG